MVMGGLIKMKAWKLMLSAAMVVPLAVSAALTFGGPARAAEGVNVGDKAPDFKLAGTDGKTYTLSQFKGKSWVVIAWYPKALTGG